MIITNTNFDDLKIINPDIKEDERGFFARLFCENEFKLINLQTNFLQINNSLSKNKGTLRGMHYQLPPASEVKLVRVISGSIQDVVIDLRPHSKLYGDYFSINLNSENRTMLYIPEGFAHGFLTLTDNVEIIYLVSNFYSPDNERGIRFDDSKFNIKWEDNPSIISKKDKNWPAFNDNFHQTNKFL